MDAKKRGLEGKYLIALLNTTIQPYETDLQNRALRERLHRASVARGTRGNEFDTRATCLACDDAAPGACRAAGLQPTPAAFVLEEETAKSADTVNALLRQLAPAAVASAKQEAAELQSSLTATRPPRSSPASRCKPGTGAITPRSCAPASTASTRASSNRISRSPACWRSGVFFAANQLYGISFKRRTDLPVYRDDVRVPTTSSTPMASSWPSSSPTCTPARANAAVRG